MKGKIFSVSQLNQYIKHLMDDDVLLSDVFVEGEISNCKPHTSGHWYFTLKDSCALPCVMFRSAAQRLQFMPENGMQVVAFGRVSVYEKTGQYQLYVDVMEPAGKGALFIAFEQLKNKLEQEGLFLAARKKELPRFPRCVAVVTSPTGAAVRDMIQIIKRRNRTVEILVVPVLVQGADAAASIAKGIADSNRSGLADVIIVGRGGGSIEDLWAFNEEVVARAIGRSQVPVVSAVGHETDFTIADWVADLRAPTPSAAAELVVPALADLERKLDSIRFWLDGAMNGKLKQMRETWDRLVKSRVMTRPLETVYQKQMMTEQLLKRLNHHTQQQMNQYRLRMTHSIENLEMLSPLAVLQRGYSVALDADGAIVATAKQAQEQKEFALRFQDGTVEVLVKE